ncbi:helix-turn-helix transcriptional regulator [Georgenia phoenicis]|uniref:helix-turn-helix domain-containing protein n=1 Tax=unclassified Georgenia TaxID=2626815 RepID=UPI0039AF8013
MTTSKPAPLWQLSGSGYGEPLSALVAATIRWEASRYELTQQDLAAYLHRSRSAVSQRFTGRVPWSLDDLGRIAEAMGVKPGYLLEEPPAAAWRA